MSKTQTRSRQLELPVLVTLATEQAPRQASNSSPSAKATGTCLKVPTQASAKDEAIYQAISENYFRNLD
ncbi:hypothetical protein [Burkholderia metallica]|uniref:hypothetical protein n=1 Tax=Burkholderia metallica TaxID=488729 RepID=UPI001CF49A0D|nr:hypothetical protein [Burkholderia metallica]MCA8003131.1 hypothetical protein [Burkholderia metallica]